MQLGIQCPPVTFVATAYGNRPQDGCTRGAVLLLSQSFLRPPAAPSHSLPGFGRRHSCARVHCCPFFSLLISDLNTTRPCILNGFPNVAPTTRSLLPSAAPMQIVSMAPRRLHWLSGELYSLVTDVGYMNEAVVWEKLCEIDGDNIFVNSDFVIPRPKPPAEAREVSEQEAYVFAQCLPPAACRSQRKMKPRKLMMRCPGVRSLVFNVWVNKQILQPIHSESCPAAPAGMVDCIYGSRINWLARTAISLDPMSVGATSAAPTTFLWKASESPCAPMPTTLRPSSLPDATLETGTKICV